LNLTCFNLDFRRWVRARQIAELRVSPSACDELRVHAELDADVPALLDGRQQVGNIPFTLAVDAPEFHLDTLGPVLPAAVYGPHGTLRARVRGQGMLAAPELSGALRLEDAAIVVLALRQRVQNINLDLQFDRDQVALRELHADVGAGHISGHGNAEVDRGDGVEATVTLVVREVPLVRSRCARSWRFS
jgi:autotransporter translocation and assembly factor TamB